MFQDLLRRLGTKLLVLSGALGISPIMPCVDVEFDQLTKNSAAYQAKQVCVTGVTDGDGIKFALFRPPHREANHSILVFQPNDRPRHKLSDGHWVKLSGVVDVDKTGLFACILVLDSVHALNKRPIPGVRVFGIFQNEGPETVQVQTINKTDNELTGMILAPGDIQKTEIVEGKIRIFAGADSSPTKLLSACMTPTVKSTPRYFEKSTRTFYFTLKDGIISLIQPDKAKEMRTRWEAIEGRIREE